MKKYRILANMVFILHVVVMLLLLTGAGLCEVIKWYKDIFRVFLSTVVISQAIFLGCPLTTLESSLRGKYNKSLKFSGSFTSFLIYKIFGKRINPITTTALLFIVLLGNILYFIMEKM